MIKMMKKIISMPFPWNAWVMVLGMVNFIGGIYFFSRPEGKMALIAMMGAMLVMHFIYKTRGFVRLLGLGHIIFWTPFLLFSLWRLQTSALPEDFKIWLILVSILNGASLVIDFWDIWRYLNGERSEILNSNSQAR